MRLGFLGGFRRSGALLVPGHRASKSVVNWPRCGICQRMVDAYGIEDETDGFVEVWGECSGVLIDPNTGLVVGNAIRKHEKRRSSVRLEKGVGWSKNRFTDLVSRIEFFVDAGGRNFKQTFDVTGSREL